MESQAQGPCLEKGLFLRHRPRIRGDVVGPGDRLPGISSGLDLVGKLCLGDPILKTLPRGLLCPETPLRQGGVRMASGLEQTPGGLGFIWGLCSRPIPKSLLREAVLKICLLSLLFKGDICVPDPYL